ncbi:hypothetical protein FRC01_011066, partial [Tulasnella sp. 417]
MMNVIIVSPFKNSFLYLNLPYGIGKHLLRRLNEIGAFSQSITDDDAFVTSRYNAWRKKQYESFSGSLVDAHGNPLTLGYVTTDQCPGGPGDDTPHRPIPYFDAPGYVEHSNVIPSAANTTLVDVIFLNFFLGDIVRAANELRVEADWDIDRWMPRNFTVEDAAVYGDLESNQVFGQYASAFFRFAMQSRLGCAWNLLLRRQIMGVFDPEIVRLDAFPRQAELPSSATNPQTRPTATGDRTRLKVGYPMVKSQVKQPEWAPVPATEKTGDARAPRASAVKANGDPARNDATHMSPIIPGIPSAMLFMLGLLALSARLLFDFDQISSMFSLQDHFEHSSATPQRTTTYETVPGYFIHDDPALDVHELTPPPARFGLIDSSPDYWTKFKAAVKKLNDEAGPSCSYKVVFIGRHGEGYHNAAEAFYGTKEWDDYWSLLNGNGTITWGPDAKLTELGIEQARMAHKRWVTELHAGGGIPLPTKIYSSPLSRAAKTLEITFRNVSNERPLIMENLREIIGVHTCDKRSTRSQIHRAFPGFDIEKGFTEEDLLWKPDVRETNKERDTRVRQVFDKILQTDDTYIAIVAHGGIIQSSLRVVGHRPYPVMTGGVIPLFIKVTHAS